MNPENVVEMNPTKKALADLPLKAEPPKKLAPLAVHESDNIRILLLQLQYAEAALKDTAEHRAFQRAEILLRDYCNQVILRKQLDPALTAVDPTLQFIMELPAHKLAAAIAAKAAAGNAP